MSDKLSLNWLVLYLSLDSHLKLYVSYKLAAVLSVIRIAVTNIAQGKVKCYICHKTLTNSCIVSYK